MASATTFDLVVATTFNGNTLTTGTGTLTLSTFTLTVAGTASVSGTNTGDQTSVSGNAGTATALATARAIYGNNFDGSAALTQIIGSTYGGTGNGFTKFSGPTTSERTKTLRDASDTILELGGSYTPTGTWTNLTMVTPVLGIPQSGTLTNCTLPTTGLTGTITNAQLAGSIAYSKLSLTGAILNADLAGSIDLTSKVTGALPVANGGTNLASYAVGDLIYASGATTLAKLAGVAAGNALISGGVTTAFTWGKITTSHTTGIAENGLNSTVTRLTGLIDVARMEKTAAAHQSISTGTETKVVFGAASVDGNSMTDTTNSRITAKVAGRYQINTQITCDGALWNVAIRKNGTHITYLVVAPSFGNSSTPAVATWTGTLANNDYVEIWASQNSGLSQNIYADANNTWFFMQLIN